MVSGATRARKSANVASANIVSVALMALLRQLQLATNKLEFIKCKNSPNTHKAELVHCNLRCIKYIESDFWGWGLSAWPLKSVNMVSANVVSVSLTALLQLQQSLR